ncbi:CsbA family protein [Sporosarcina sp. F6_3S_P_2]|uniref:CsbA family protein n=1 Tax=Sporosarcina highlanderae TaxID=3035916 RepID=A0ABT8JQJ9_9BACL|nr:CsbA family protein [Sporosarcina highlanderae]MDN4606841.1 CsbA family protein [Sporosarcina highlanderae]
MATLETKLLLALFLPGLLVVFFTRVTFHHLVGLVLTIALIAASVYAGYTHNWILYAADAFSLTVGFWYATRMVKRAKKQGRTVDE